MGSAHPASPVTQSKTMKTTSIATLIGASAIAMLFTACESKQEEAREERLENKADNLEATADQVRKEGEKTADMKEDQADSIRKNNEGAADATENSADATRKTSEGQADALEKEADQVREQK
jgi:hypothetical protein